MVKRIVKQATDFFHLGPFKPSKKSLPKSYLNLSNGWLWFLWSLNGLFRLKKMKYKSRENAEWLLLLRSLQSLEVADKLLKENFYPESAASLRLVLESVNLIKLFQMDEAYVKKWFSLRAKKASRVFMPSNVRKLIGVTEVEKGNYSLLSNIGTHPSRMSTILMPNIKHKKIKKGKTKIDVYSKPQYNENYANWVMFFFLYSCKKLAIRILDPKERREKAKEIIAIDSDKDLVSKVRELYKISQKELERLEKKFKKQ